MKDGGDINGGYTMFDDEDRKELLEILDEEYKDARDIISNNKPMPNSMTHNGEKVGVTIKFRKFYPERDD